MFASSQALFRLGEKLDSAAVLRGGPSGVALVVADRDSQAMMFTALGPVYAVCTIGSTVVVRQGYSKGGGGVA